MRLFILSVVVLLGQATVLPAATVAQRISAVTVYPDGALVTRSGSATLGPGVQTVVFDHLPLNLDEDSVRAKASSRTTMKILGVELRRDYHEVSPSMDMQKLQDGMTKLEDQINALTDEQGDLAKRREFLDGIREKVTSPQAVESKGADGGAQEIQTLFALYGAEGSKITTRQREINLCLRDLNKQREALTGQLNLLQQPSLPNTRSALITVDAGDGGSIDMEVTYMMAGAGWQPQYDAYADPETQKVELTYYGVVRQTTGESWNDVALTLSSSRPNMAARLPEMTAWTIDFPQPAADETASLRNLSQIQSAKSVDQVTANVTSTATDAAAPSATPAAPAAFALAEVHSLGPAATFVVPAKTTVPSDDQPHRSAICVQSLKGEWSYEASPKLAPGAFLKTHVTNTSGGPLLGGEINAFLGNNFIGKSNIGLVAANASFDLFLGADENIKVTRTEGVKKEETGGILSRQRIYRRSFVIEVENFKSTAIALQLHDQVPVSKNGDIQVRTESIEPANHAPNPDTGEVTWEVKLRPAEKEKFTVNYEVDVPYDKPLIGI
jgi:uncharacterized protein (TIGR02231 family)